jgi:hypothetical protein
VAVARGDADSSAIADRSHHRTRNDRPDPWNRDQLLAAFISACQGLDLIRHPFDALIEIGPISYKSSMILIIRGDSTSARAARS